MIRILVDSGADYTAEERKEKHIEMVPLKLIFGDTEYDDGVDLGADEFFTMLTTGPVTPHTSQPSPQAFLAPFEDAKEKGDEMICILISSSVSGTFQSAEIARDMAGYEKIHLVDSRTATVGMQYLADTACRMRDEGAAADEICDALENLKSHTRVFFTVDTLEYLYRGGRLSRTSALVGRLANMKPVLTLEAGEVGVSDICLGMSRAQEHVVKHLETRPIDENFPLYTLFSDGEGNCEKLEHRLEKRGLSSFTRKRIGSVIGTHIGPGAAGLFYVEAEKGPAVKS